MTFKPTNRQSSHHAVDDTAAVSPHRAESRYSSIATPSTSPGWTPTSWRQRPVAQQPDWTDEQALDEVLAELRAQPPLVLAEEARALTTALGEAAAGKGFLLQAGDCSESFGELSTRAVHDRLRVILQMATVLTYSSQVRVVKVPRMAGQFAKPRSSLVERVGDIELPVYRGDIVNEAAPDAAARVPDPKRLMQAYHHSAAKLNFVRGLAGGGLALSEVDAWIQEFVATSPEGHRYEPIATEIQRAVKFVRASHTDPREDWLLGADLWTSHEALLLPYEEALVRRDQESGEWFGSSGHLLWVGERTRAVDGAHVEFLSGLENPVACKLGPTATADEVVSLCERLNPDRIPGRLTLISRMGVTQVTEALPPLLAATRDEAHPVIWAVDPMHGNTLETSSGRKTRRFDDIIEEVQGFFAACASESTWPGGLHVELTGEDVTECLGGSEDLSEADLDICYTTTCDPRLNARQALDLAFRVAELLRIGMQP